MVSTAQPTVFPTAQPTVSPTAQPTASPTTSRPTISLTFATSGPSNSYVENSGSIVYFEGDPLMLRWTLQRRKIASSTNFLMVDATSCPVDRPTKLIVVTRDLTDASRIVSNGT